MFGAILLVTQTTFKSSFFILFCRHCSNVLLTVGISWIGQKLSCLSGSKVDGSGAVFSDTMPRAKQFGKAEKSKVMAWYDEGVTPKDIAERLSRNADSVRKIIRIHKDLPLSATPPPPKKYSGRPRKTNFAQDERLRRFICMRNPVDSHNTIMSLYNSIMMRS